jgi:hypothetical protein
LDVLVSVLETAVVLVSKVVQVLVLLLAIELQFKACMCFYGTVLALLRFRS